MAFRGCDGVGLQGQGLAWLLRRRRGLYLHLLLHVLEPLDGLLHPDVVVFLRIGRRGRNDSAGAERLLGLGTHFDLRLFRFIIVNFGGPGWI